MEKRYNWVVGYREKQQKKTYYYVKIYQQLPPIDIVDLVDDFIANKEQNYIVRHSKEFKRITKKNSNIWIIIDFHDKKYEACLPSILFNEKQELSRYMLYNQYDRDNIDKQ
jgi:hypothetical protein